MGGWGGWELRKSGCLFVCTSMTLKFVAEGR